MGRVTQVLGPAPRVCAAPGTGPAGMSAYGCLVNRSMRNRDASGGILLIFAVCWQEHLGGDRPPPDVGAPFALPA